MIDTRSTYAYWMSDAMREVIEQGVEEHHDEGALLSYWENQGEYWNDRADEFLSSFDEAYAGTWDSFAQYAEQWFDDVYAHEVPEFLVNYIDYEAFARDLSYDYFTVSDGNYGVRVFRSI